MAQRHQSDIRSILPEEKRFSGAIAVTAYDADTCIDMLVTVTDRAIAKDAGLDRLFVDCVRQVDLVEQDAAGENDAAALPGLSARSLQSEPVAGSLDVGD